MVYFSVPPEIWDHVMDHLHDDKAALSACGSVRRTWTVSARFHLFHRVIVDCHEDDLNLVSNIFPQFGGTLDRYIRDFRIVGLRPPKNFIDIRLPVFPSLTSLTVSCNYPWEQLPDTMQQWMTEQVRNLPKFRLSMDFEDVENALHLLASARLLHTLDFANDIHVALHTTQRSATLFEQYVPPLVHDFTAGFTSRSDGHEHVSVFLLKWMKFHGGKDTLKSFSVAGRWSQVLDKVAQCLNETVPFIQHLGFDADDPHDLYVSNGSFGLSKIPSLQRITLVATFSSSFLPLTNLLSTLLTPALKLVIFEVTFTYDEERRLKDGEHHLSDLDDYFSDSKAIFSAQSAGVKFVCYPEHHRASVEYAVMFGVQDLLQTALPRMHSQGRVAVDIRKENTTYWFE